MSGRVYAADHLNDRVAVFDNSLMLRATFKFARPWALCVSRETPQRLYVVANKNDEDPEHSTRLDGTITRFDLTGRIDGHLVERSGPPVSFSQIHALDCSQPTELVRSRCWWCHAYHSAFPITLV